MESYLTEIRVLSKICGAESIPNSAFNIRQKRLLSRDGKPSSIIKCEIFKRSDIESYPTEITVLSKICGAESIPNSAFNIRQKRLLSRDGKPSPIIKCEIFKRSDIESYPTEITVLPKICGAESIPNSEFRIPNLKKISLSLLTTPSKCVITVLQQVVQLIQIEGDIMFAIDLRERTPIYEQLYKRIAELVIKGELKQDDKLPSVRELAKELGVNPNTVAKAFQMLERDKVIYSLQGRGSFIAAVRTDSIKERALTAFDAAVAEALKAGLTADELILRIKNSDEKGLDKNETHKQEK